jgi:beta-phosphoglucomutase
MQTRVVIFDLDGVLTSTTSAHFSAWSEIFLKHFDLILDPSLEQRTKGVSRMDSLSILLDAYQIKMDRAQKELLASEKNQGYQQAIAHFDESQILPGVLPFLSHLKEKRLHLALGSASRNGPFLLKAMKLDHFFDYVVDPSPLRGKPYPDIFLEAARHFNVLPGECVGIEDAMSGIEAIKRAGMRAIGVGPEDLVNADLKMETFSDVDYSLIDQFMEVC